MKLYLALTNLVATVAVVVVVLDPPPEPLMATLMAGNKSVPDPSGSKAEQTRVMVPIARSWNFCHSRSTDPESMVLRPAVLALTPASTVVTSTPPPVARVRPTISPARSAR